MPLRHAFALGAFLVPGAVLLGWALLVAAPAETDTKGQAERIAELVEDKQNDQLIGIEKTLTVASLSRELTDGDRTRCDAYLAAVLATNGLLGNVGKLNPDGTVACSAKPAPVTANFKDDGFIRRALVAKSFVLSRFRLGTVTHRPQLGAALPVVAPGTTDVAFIVFAGIDLAKLDNRLLEANFPTDTSITLIDADGTVLARQPAIEGSIGKKMPNFDDVRRMTSTSGALYLDGSRRYVAVTALGDGDNPAMVVVSVAAPVSVTTLSELAGGALLVGVVLAVMVLIGSSRSFLWQTGSRRAYIAATIGIVLIFVAGGGAIVRILALENDWAWWVEHTYQVIGLLQEAEVDLARIDGNVAAIASRNRSDDGLAAAVAANDLVDQSAEITALVVDNPEQEARAKRLGEASQDLANQMHALLPSGGGNAATVGALDAVSTADADMTGLVATMQAEEERLLAIRKEAATLAERQAIAVSTAIGVFALLLLIMGARIIEGQARARAEAEAALAERERLYRLIVDNMTDLIVAGGLDGTRHFVSPSSLELFGYRPEELTGGQSLELVHPDDAPRLAALYRNLAAGQESAEILVRSRHKDGRYRWIDANLRLLRNPETGTPEQFVASLRDAQDRVEAETALRASEEQFRIISENASDVIVVIGIDGKRRYASPSHETVLGYTVEEVLSGTFGSYLHPDDQAAVTESLRSMYGDNPQPVVVARALHKDGHEIWIEGHTTLVRDSDTGAPVETVTLIRDITAQKLAAEQLEAARQEAEQANRVKSDFLASMSHEIRTPMNGVIGFATLLLETEITTSQRRMLTLLKESGEALLAIINDILDLSKIEAGHLELEAIPVNLRGLIEGAAALIEPQVKAKGLKIDTTVDPAIPEWVLGDPTRLRQVLLNFLSNAVKFTTEGGVGIRVRREDAPGTRLRFSVEDTGIGIMKERLPLLFRPFTQIDRSITRRFGGTGLGLAISKRLIEAMPDGAVGVESEPGKGSVFWFALELAETAAPVATEEQHRAPARPARILVAEDLYINQVIVEEMLTRAGHMVTLANDGAAAIETLKEEEFDLVLMDMQMPVMDGLEATRAIRAGDPRTKDIPIIALTANAMVEEVQKCRDAGMSDYLSKPIAQDALLRAVDKWNGSGRAAEIVPLPTDRAPAAVINDTVLKELENRLGRTRVLMFVGMVQEQLAKSLAAIGGVQVNETELERETHVLISLAGNVGLTELTDWSRKIHDRLRRGARFDDVADDLTVLLEAAGRAVVALDRRYPPGGADVGVKAGTAA